MGWKDRVRGSGGADLQLRAQEGAGKGRGRGGEGGGPRELAGGAPNRLVLPAATGQMLLPHPGAASRLSPESPGRLKEEAVAAPCWSRARGLRPPGSGAQRWVSKLWLFSPNTTSLGRFPLLVLEPPAWGGGGPRGVGDLGSPGDHLGP